jgi:hypothetical protein
MGPDSQDGHEYPFVRALGGDKSERTCAPWPRLLHRRFISKLSERAGRIRYGPSVWFVGATGQA